MANITPDQRLSDHFWLSEFTTSAWATRNGVSNAIPDVFTRIRVGDLGRYMESVRRILNNKPITISSGYRSRAVNAAVGGAPNSAHMRGLAADFICPDFGTPADIVQALSKRLTDFDQLICEGTWVHIAIPEAGVVPRRQVLTAIFTPQGTQYEPFIYYPHI